MDVALWAVAAGASALAFGALAVAVSCRSRVVRTERMLAEARAEVAELRTSLDAAQRRPADPPDVTESPPAEFLITTAGEDPLSRVPDRAVLSATLGEPLLKAVALAYGVRRALSAPSRNRILFEMRQEVGRSRKQRRRDLRRARRASYTRRGRAPSSGAAA